MIPCAERITSDMKYKAIIFDLDGVICFTDEYHYLACEEKNKIAEFYSKEGNG